MKKQFVALLVLVGISMLLVGCHNLRKVPPATMTGQVVDENGIPLSGVRVELEGYDRSAITDLDGFFELDNVYGGKYSLKYELDEYVGSAIVSIAGNPVNVGKLELRLEPLFADDFSTQLAEWNLDGGATVSDGQLTLSDGSIAGLNCMVGDMSVRFELTPPADADEGKVLMINLHNTDPEGMWPLDTRAGYTIWLKGNGVATFLKPTPEGGAQWLLESDWVLWTPDSIGESVIIDVTKTEGPSRDSTRIQVKINGAKVIDYITPGMGVERNDGYLGFHSHGGGTWKIDDLRLREF